MKEGCDDRTKTKGTLCMRHAANPKRYHCKIDGCSNRSQEVKGLCCRHGAPLPRCSVEGCNCSIMKFGVCASHSPLPKQPKCTLEGCIRFSKKEGFCDRHFKKYATHHDDCDAPEGAS